MVDLDSLPAAMTATEINRDIFRCAPQTLRRALAAGQIKGRRINGKRIAYETQSVLRWLGLVETAEE